MKKIISLLLATLLLATSCFAFTCNDVDDATAEKIENALKADKYAAYQHSYKQEIKPFEITNLISFDILYKFDDCYVVSYGDYHYYAEWCTAEILGDCVAHYIYTGGAVYVESEDKIYNCLEAYENGILTDEILADLAINTRQHEDTVDFIQLGDFDRNNTIDVLDLMQVRSYIITGEEPFDYCMGNHATMIADLNKDGSVDILDIALMRNIIVNGK